MLISSESELIVLVNGSAGNGPKSIPVLISVWMRSSTTRPDTAVDAVRVVFWKAAKEALNAIMVAMSNTAEIVMAIRSSGMLKPRCRGRVFLLTAPLLQRRYEA